MKQLTGLFEKALRHELFFSYSPHVQLCDIWTFKGERDENDHRELVEITSGYVREGKSEETLNRMHHELDNYIENQEVVNENG